LITAKTEGKIIILQVIVIHPLKNGNICKVKLNFFILIKKTFGLSAHREQQKSQYIREENLLGVFLVLRTRLIF